MYIQGVIMETKIQKWGNSLGVRIPKTIAEEAGIEPGSVVQLSMKNGSLVMKPARRKKYKLEDFVRRITPENVHEEVDFGAPVGKEIW